MRTPSREELRAVANLRIALRRFLAATDTITGRHGLTARHYDLLAILHASPDGCTPTELARSLQLTRNATTELITRAENRGLVQRAQTDPDRRRKTVRPTTVGTELFYAALSDLTPERQRLLAILGESYAT